MIKTIEWQKPVQMTIIKNGETVADFYVPGISGGLDTDKIKTATCEDSSTSTMKLMLEV